METTTIFTLVKYLGLGSGASITFLVAWLLWQHFRIISMSKDIIKIEEKTEEQERSIYKSVGRTNVLTNCIENLQKTQDDMNKKLDSLIEFNLTKRNSK